MSLDDQRDHLVADIYRMRDLMRDNAALDFLGSQVADQLDDILARMNERAAS